MKPVNTPYYVAIGASAGGLEAIAGFFKKMQVDSGMIFVVIQHLSPDYKSMMDELLSKVTAIPIEVVKDGTEPEPNHIYLIPPRTNMTIFHGKLLLEPQDRSGMINLPIDLFFTSLAEDQGRNAIAIVLSGTGSDGTRGCRAIKEAGGLVMVQSEQSAKFGGMPKSVIANGLADIILPVEELPAHVLKYANHPVSGSAVQEHLPEPEEKSALSKLFSMLRSRTKVDFTFYKPPTILRRIHRRMSITQVKTMDDYVDYMVTNPDEQLILYRELLIGVTNFFRDSDAFNLLQERHFLEYVERCDRDEIRIWVAGCSTGEEAYSLCMLFREICDNLGINRELKVFATDIDQDALNRASLGAYPESIAADVPHALLNKYFLHKEEGYHISHVIREMVVFARHDLIKDPPFTNIDLVSCRNLLIYLQPALQRRILDGFNFSLRPGGILFLGSSESLGDVESYFEVMDHKWKIFRSAGKRRSLLADERFSSPDPLFISRDWLLGNRRTPEGHSEEVRTLESFLDAVSGIFIPFSMIISEENQLIRVMGDSSNYLKPIAGRVTTDVTKLLINELSVPVMTGLTKVFKSRSEVSFSNVRVKQDGKTRKVNILIKPLEVRRNTPLLATVLITEAGTLKEALAKETNYDADVGTLQRVADLEQELQFTRESLQATIEELETSNEELQATNEELLASNEELQSTNEELQSVNEELFTVNSEYQGKITEMSELNTDLQNFMAASQTIAVFLDMAGNIRRFTPNAKSVFNILEHDVGRPFAHISHHLRNLDLDTCVQDAITKIKLFEREIQSDTDDWYDIRIMPYLLNNNQPSGVIIVLFEINSLRAAQDELLRNSQRDEVANIVANAATWAWEIDSKEMVWSANIESVLGMKTGSMERTYREFLSRIHPDDKPVLEKQMNYAIKHGESFSTDMRVLWSDDSIHWISQKCTPVRNDNGTTTHILGVIHNIDAIKR